MSVRHQGTAAAGIRWGTGRIPGRGVLGDLELKPKESLVLSEEVQNILNKDVDPKKLRIEESGHIYLPAGEYRRVLCNAFGIAGWQFFPITPGTVTPGGGNDPNTQRTLTRRFALVVQETLLAESTETVEFVGVPQEKILELLSRLQYDGFGHCCQQIGIADELKEPPYLADWRAKYAKQLEEVSEVDGKEVQKRIWRQI
ncbi:uncharacterized protein LOC135813511 [Sycon ciliatum]|uniref:uncharacterized protein LOC135813511 n=1 Tax=Sycon ciliatum TaxID=27933 RepID=UPI0031F6087A